jgi:hypothetical protein
MAVKTVRDILVADVSVTALVGQRISPTTRAQDTTLPCVVLSLISVVPTNHLNGAPTLDANRVQLDVFAETYASARAVADACRASLETAGVAMDNEIDDFEPDVSEHRITQDFMVWT